MNRAAAVPFRDGTQLFDGRAPGTSVRSRLGNMGLASAVALIVLTACASAVYMAPEHCAPVTIAAESINPFLATLEKYFPNENVLCLYGVQRHDTTAVAFLLPAKIDSTRADRVWYEACPVPTPDFLQSMHYLGTQHNHPDGTCEFSRPDDFSFMFDKLATIDVLTCKDGTLIRRKAPR